MAIDPRAALAEVTGQISAAFIEDGLAERGVLLVTEEGLADAVWRAIYDLQSRDDKQSQEDAAAIFAALARTATDGSGE